MPTLLEAIQAEKDKVPAEQAQEDREDLAERARKNCESDLLRRIPFLRFFDYGHLPE